MTPTAIHPLPGTLEQWREVLTRHYLSLGPASRRLRFLSAATDAACRAIAGKSAPSSVLALEAEGQVVGIVEIFSGGRRAEIGLSVEDGFQGRGYGRRLLEAGLAEAGRLGCEVADFVFDPKNAGLRRLVASAGARIEIRGGEARAEIVLSRDAEGVAA